MNISGRALPRGYSRFFALAAGIGALGAGPALAQTFLQAPALLGNAGGLRPALAAHGVSLTFTDSENLLANLAGGVKTGTTLQGVTTGTLELDTAKAFGWPGGILHVSALQIHGRSLSGPYLANLQTANGNEAEDGARLWEMWYDQSLAGGRADVKIGQQSIDNEFVTSKYSGLFINTMAGWPLLPSEDLYAGGPAYPLASLGARLQLQPAGDQSILAGVFDDNPGGSRNFSADGQQLDRSGGRFSFATGALFIAEYGVSASPLGLPGRYKIGFWYDTGGFPDQRYGTDGLSLAAPASNGTPLMHHGNHSMYAVADQTIWQSAGDSSRNINLFGRIMAAPDAQNYIDFFFNGGITMAAPLPGRDADQLGVDFGLGKVSRRKAGLERDSASRAQTDEELFELTYQAVALPWLVVQPDVQYIVNPGAGIADPQDPARGLGNELVAGVRVVSTF